MLVRPAIFAPLMYFHLYSSALLLRQIVNMLQQVMCKHDAEKLAISVLDIYKGGYREE
ncbi:MAG: hypothetical protein ACXWEP_05365 [Halobacteriota archaeon]